MVAALRALLGRLLGGETEWVVTLRARQRDGTDAHREERVIAHDEAGARPGSSTGADLLTPF